MIRVGWGAIKWMGSIKIWKDIFLIQHKISKLSKKSVQIDIQEIRSWAVSPNWFQKGKRRLSCGVTKSAARKGENITNALPCFSPMMGVPSQIHPKSIKYLTRALYIIMVNYHYFFNLSYTAITQKMQRGLIEWKEIPVQVYDGIKDL